MSVNYQFIPMEDDVESQPYTESTMARYGQFLNFDHKKELTECTARTAM